MTRDLPEPPAPPHAPRAVRGRRAGGALLRGILLLVGLGASAFLVLGTGTPRVLRPRLGVPAVVAPRGSFDVRFERCLFDLSGPLTLELVRPGEAVGVPLAELPPLHSMRPVDVPVALPAAVGPGAWDLRVRGGSDEQRLVHAVHVRDAWPDRLRVVYLADLPVLWSDGSGERALARLVDEANWLDADLVLLGGDNVYGGQDERYRALMRQLERVEAPVVVSIGNHEYENLANYRRHFATARHVVDVGPLRLVCTNSAHGRDQFTDEQLAWIEGALEDVGGRTPLLLVHHPLFGPRRLGVGVDRVVELCEAHDVPLVLSGHRHADTVYDGTRAERASGTAFDGTLYVVTTSGGADLHPEHGTGETYHGLRLLELERPAPGEPHLPTRISYDSDGDGVPEPSASWPTGLLTWSFEGDALVVHNGWSEVARDLRVPRSLLVSDEPQTGPEPALVRRDLPAAWSEHPFDLAPGESRRFPTEVH